MRDDGGVDERDKSVIHKSLKFYTYYILALDLNILYIQNFIFQLYVYLCIQKISHSLFLGLNIYVNWKQYLIPHEIMSQIHVKLIPGDQLLIYYLGHDGSDKKYLGQRSTHPLKLSSAPCYAWLTTGI